MTEARDSSPRPVQLVVDTGILENQSRELRAQVEEAETAFDSAMDAATKAGKPISEDTLRLNFVGDLDEAKDKPVLPRIFYQNQIKNKTGDPELLYKEGMTEAKSRERGHELWAIELVREAARRTPAEARYAYAWRYFARRREARSQRIMGKRNKGRRELAAQVGWTTISKTPRVKPEAV